MLILGLTGGIACGKSNVSDKLHELGAVIVDGDLLSRQLTAPGGAALPELRKAFGDRVFSADGALDRAALGAAVFGHPEELARLDALMGPLLMALTKQRIHEAEAAGAKLCVLDMPLLYEKGYDTLCDTVWAVFIPPEEQLARLMTRNGFSRAEAQRRIDSQMSAAEKAARADTVIDTSGTIEQTRAKVPPLYQALLQEGGAT